MVAYEVIGGVVLTALIVLGVLWLREHIRIRNGGSR
jgi:hypothetical protein